MIEDLLLCRTVEEIEAGPRPWETEPSVDRWEAYGFRCMILRTHAETANLCGYVGVKRDHPLYGVRLGERSTRLEYLLKRRMNETYDSNRVPIGTILKGLAGMDIEPTPESALSVHGGLTFAAKGRRKTPWDRSRFWFGFDCAHAGDLLPGFISLYRRLSEERGAGNLFRTMAGVYRDFNYVRVETERLAAQLSILMG